MMGVATCACARRNRFQLLRTVCECSCLSFSNSCMQQGVRVSDVCPLLLSLSPHGRYYRGYLSIDVSWPVIQSSWVTFHSNVGTRLCFCPHTSFIRRVKRCTVIYYKTLLTHPGSLPECSVLDHDNVAQRINLQFLPAHVYVCSA